MADIEAQRLLSEIREITGQTLSQVAIYAEVTPPTIYNIANGKTGRTEEWTKIKLEKYLKRVQKKAATDQRA